MSLRTWKYIFCCDCSEEGGRRLGGGVFIGGSVAAALCFIHHSEIHRVLLEG